MLGREVGNERQHREGQHAGAKDQQRIHHPRVGRSGGDHIGILDRLDIERVLGRRQAFIAVSPGGLQFRVRRSLVVQQVDFLRLRGLSRGVGGFLRFVSYKQSGVGVAGRIQFLLVGFERLICRRDFLDALVIQ